MIDPVAALPASQRFLALVLDGEPPTLTALYRALDNLAMAYHATPDIEPDTSDVEAPRRDQSELRRELSPRFPKLGYYNALDTDRPLGAPALVGDAIDDLVDIVQDLMEVVWLFENSHINDAHWTFRFGYEHHWGQHLRGLSLYLHELIFMQHAEYEATGSAS